MTSENYRIQDIYISYWSVVLSWLVFITWFPQIQDFLKGIQSVKNINEIIYRVPIKIQNYSDFNSVEETSTAIEIRDVGFRFEDSKEDSRNLDAKFVIKKGETTVLVGESGSGRSLIPKLLTERYNFSKEK